jgi:hypothetical protein
MEFILILIIILQTIVSIIYPVYKDTGWIKETWFGNDIVTLFVVCPLFIICVLGKQNILEVIKTGCIGYFIYNYSFYMLGTELNTMFLSYVMTLCLSIFILVISVISQDKINKIYQYYNDKRKLLAAIVFIFIGIGLFSVWTMFWVGYTFFGSSLPTDVNAFRLVASLDYVLMVFPLVLSGILLIKNQKIGLLIGSISGIQGLLYLVVLTINTVLLSNYNKKYLNELPIWGTLLIIQSIGVYALIRNKKVLTSAST